MNCPVSLASANLGIWHGACSLNIDFLNTVTDMKVRREKPSKRLKHRVDAPLMVDLPEGEFKASDWSLGGFGIEGYTGVQKLGDIFAASLHLPFQGFGISFQADVEVKRLTESGSLGVEFTELGDREHELMRHFIDDLVRGSMTTVEDTILRIDTPVTPVSVEPEVNPASEVPFTRWPLKAIVMTGFYMTLGAIVVGYAALVFHSNFVRLEVTSAVVSAPVETILSTADGKIESISVNPGQLLPQRTAMISIDDNRLLQAVDMASIRVDRATVALRQKQKIFQSEAAKLKDYSSIAKAQIDRTSTRIKALQERSSLAFAQEERFSTLFNEGWTTRSKLDEVQSQHAELAAELEEARQLMHERRMLLDSIEQGRFYTGDKFDGRLQEAKAELDFAVDEVMLAKDELSALLNHKKRLELYAPGEGRIIRFLKNSGSSVKRGEEIALFEHNVARTIEAYLTQDEILEVGFGNMATVFFPSLDASVQAFVTNIDRASGYVNEKETRYQWRAAEDRTARVTLQFTDIPLEDIRNRFAPGLPAIVIFERQNIDDRIHSIRNQIRKEAASGTKT